MAAVQISIPVRFWAPLPAVIAAGILSTYYFGMTGTFWAVTGEFTRWGGHVLQWFGLHPEQWGYFKVIGLQGTPLERIDGRMIIGMFAGCIAAALWANNIKLRQPQHRIRIVQALLGGIIAGFGARPAMGCNRRRSSPVFLSFRCTPGSSRWRPPRVRTSAPNSRCCRCSASRSNCKGEGRRAADAET